MGWGLGWPHPPTWESESGMEPRQNSDCKLQLASPQHSSHPCLLNGQDESDSVPYFLICKIGSPLVLK